MRRALSLGIAFACIGCGALAEEASVFGGGGLNLKVRNLSFAPYVVSPGWKGTGKMWLETPCFPSTCLS